MTHEQDIADHCKRIVRFRDGMIQSDERVESPVDAKEILARLPQTDQAAS